MRKVYLSILLMVFCFSISFPTHGQTCCLISSSGNAACTNLNQQDCRDIAGGFPSNCSATSCATPGCCRIGFPDGSVQTFEGVSMSRCGKIRLKSAATVASWQKDPCGSNIVVSDVNVESLKSVFVPTEQKVTLNWDDLPGIEFEGFYVQKSRDGKLFKTIGFLANSNESNIHGYFYSDIYPYALTYYRIVWFLSNGDQLRSQSITATTILPGKVAILPNPSREKINILFSNHERKITWLSIYDLMGRPIFRTTFSDNHQEVDVGLLP